MRIKKKQENKDISLKPQNVFDYLESLSQKAKDLMNKKKDADDDIDIYKLVFIGSNRKKFNFKIFWMPLNFLSTIYNGEITLKKAKVSQRKLEKKIEELKYNYKPKNVQEKEEINAILMHANDRDKNIEAFRDSTFLSEHLKIQTMLHMIMCYKV